MVRVELDEPSRRVRDSLSTLTIALAHFVPLFQDLQNLVGLAFLVECQDDQLDVCDIPVIAF
jgi:hypothetical protein